MERPDYDISYLSYPMAYSMNTGLEALLQFTGFGLNRNSPIDSHGNSISDLEMHERFMENLDLESGEVYLRKWAYNFVISHGYITSEAFEEAEHLTWCDETKTALFTFEDIAIEIVTQEGSEGDSDSGVLVSLLGRIANDRMVVAEYQLHRATTDDEYFSEEWIYNIAAYYLQKHMGDASSIVLERQPLFNLMEQLVAWAVPFEGYSQAGHLLLLESTLYNLLDFHRKDLAKKLNRGKINLATTF